jgi:hypothetical protein
MNARKLCTAMLFLTAAAHVYGQDKSAELDNGTDPTRLSRAAQAQYEHLDLKNGVTSGTLRLSYTQPFTEKRDYSVRFRVPIASVDARGNDDFGIGDASLMVSHVFGLTRAHGFVVQGEMVFDTAARDELGTGKNVFKGTFVYARFLAGGNIFAPAVVQSYSLWGQSNRADVNSTTIDFYFVPKFADKRNLMTFDPSIVLDWEGNKRYGALAVTFGRVLGPAFGGNAIVSIKPTVFAGGDRPGSWGVDIAYKVIGF